LVAAADAVLPSPHHPTPHHNNTADGEPVKIKETVNVKSINRN
jgi:hypothetical protein